MVLCYAVEESPAMFDGTTGVYGAVRAATHARKGWNEETYLYQPFLAF